MLIYVGKNESGASDICKKIEIWIYLDSLKLKFLLTPENRATLALF